jgi:transposase
MQIPEIKRLKVKEISLDMAANMKLAAQTLFPNARLVTDRFHVVRLVTDAVQDIRIAYRKQAIEQENKEIAKCRRWKRAYNPERYSNGDTKKELLARSRYLLYRLPDKCTQHQKERAKILFKEFPKLKNAYRLAIQFRKIYGQQDIQKAKSQFRKWLKLLKISGMEEFNSVARSIVNHQESILNFFINRSTNAFAESFNAKVKLYRANLRGVSNPTFFLFRLQKLFA